MRNLIDRYRIWRAVRAELKYRRWLRSSRVMYVGKIKPEPRCVVHNSREIIG